MLNKLIWDLFLIPYYQVYVTKNNKVLKVFYQKTSASDNNTDIALIDKSNKLCWWITQDYLLHKNKFIFVCDIENAIPVIIEEKKDVETGLINIEKTVRTYKIKKVDNEKDKVKNKDIGLPKVKTYIYFESVKGQKIPFPSSVLFEVINGAFVKKALSSPDSIWESLKIPLTIFALGLIFIIWQLTQNIGVSQI